MVEIPPTGTVEAEDIDAKLKAASKVLVAEMEELIRQAKLQEAEHEATATERRRLKKLP